MSPGEAEAAQYFFLVISIGASIGGPIVIVWHGIRLWRLRRAIRRSDRFLHGGA